MLHVHRTSDPESAVAVAVSQYLNKRAGTPTLLLIAGGSLPATVLPHLDRQILTPDLTISILDERCTTDDTGRNQLQLHATPFYQEAQHAGVQTLEVLLTETAVCPAVAADWEARLRAWQKAAPSGEIVVLAGVGADGHIAGILCHSPAETPVFSGTEWIVAHHFTGIATPYPYRITPTFTFWQEAVTTSFVYLSGPEKAVASQAIQVSTADLAATPGAILSQPSVGSVQLFID